MLTQIPEIDGTTQVRPVNLPGGFLWAINFKLPVPAANDGYIIQAILQNDEGVFNAVPSNKISFYFEAWEVKKGETTPKQSQTVSQFISGLGGNKLSDSKYNVPINDIFYRQFVFGCRGTYKITGMSGFYENSLPPNFVTNNLQTGAGQLRSSLHAPDFWSIQAYLHRELTFTYDFTNSKADLKDDSKGRINRKTSIWDVRDFVNKFV